MHMSAPGSENENAGYDYTAVWSIGHIAKSIASFLPANDVAATLRLVSTSLASTLRDCNVVKLSQPCPPHAFAHRWGSAGAAHGLPLKRRQRLLCLTAAAGDLDNLKLALETVSCPPTSRVLAAAASAGHIHICAFLLQHGCSRDTSIAAAAIRCGQAACFQWLQGAGLPIPEDALEVAAMGGHAALCDLLTGQGPHTWGAAELRAAAHGGRVALLEAALEGLDPAALPAKGRGAVLAAAAEGCDLGTLRWLHHMLMERSCGAGEEAYGGQEVLQRGNPELQQQQQPPPHEPQQVLDDSARAEIVGGAAACPGAGWWAKMEWLLAQGYPKTAAACTRAAALPDGPTRLAWLRQHGFPLDAPAAGQAALKASATATLAYLFETESLTPATAVRLPAATHGATLEALQLLHAYGLRLRYPSLLVGAAGVGRLELLRWLLEGARETGGGKLPPSVLAPLYNAAAASGGLAKLELLREFQVPWNGAVFAAVADAGGEEQLEWVAAHGCPMGDDGEAYVQAAKNGDMATLRCLRRLGCPWGAHGQAFTGAVAWACELGILRWLLAEGCPVDWAAAEDAARFRQRPPGVLEWVQDQRRERGQQGQERREEKDEEQPQGRGGGKRWRCVVQ